MVKMEALFDSFLQFDLSVFQWIQGIHNDFLDTLMKGVTTLGNAGAIFIVIGLVLLFSKKYRKAGVSVLVALLVMLIFNDLFLKEFFARPRPFNLFESNPEKYAFWGVALFVAIPLPATGAWTGSLVAAVFNMKFWKSVLSAIIGILIAGVVMTLVSYGFVAVFS